MTILDIRSFGCRLNTYESEVIRAAAKVAGLNDAVVFNTCAVTAEAMRQARQSIRRARAERPGVRIVVTGCAAQVNPRMFASMPEVDLVLGNIEKLSPHSYRAFGLDEQEKVKVNSIAEVAEVASHMVGSFAGHSRAFVQIQNGCDHRCTFCIIPFARGPSRSVPIGAIIEELRRLVHAGYHEAVLTGVDITAYGADLPGRPALGVLVRKILRSLPELRRLRLSSIDSVEADSDLLRAFAEDERLLPHVHLSLQSGDDMILKRMKRRHRRIDALTFTERLRQVRKDIVFGADFIAGFPTETDQMFSNTLNHIQECRLTYLHIFPFSPHPGTPAARMPQLPAGLLSERAAILRNKGARLRADFMQGQIGKTRSVLVEHGNRGHTEHFAPVRFAAPVAPRTITEAAITGCTSDHLLAAVLR
jgi:threonylcarbamoyladenosine tRNA methylthiotransferase MtaB